MAARPARDSATAIHPQLDLKINARVIRSS
jgi:hypothetical protein